MGNLAGGLAPIELPVCEKAGTDEMHVVQKRIVMSGRQNRPSLNGAEAGPLEYQDAVIQGFAATYQLILKHRDKMLKGDGPVARFAR